METTVLPGQVSSGATAVQALRRAEWGPAVTLESGLCSPRSLSACLLENVNPGCGASCSEGPLAVNSRVMVLGVVGRGKSLRGS